MSASSLQSLTLSDTPAPSIKEPLKPYPYSPLSHPDEIRLIRFAAGGHGKSSLPRIEIYHARLESNIVFKALSYTWGSASELVSITSDNDGHGVIVTPNCASALCRLYEDDAKTPLWIDGISVNQGNPAERSQQVAIMRDIYHAAKKVMIYLGEEEAHSDLAMQYVIEFNKAGRKGRVDSRKKDMSATAPAPDVSSPVPKALRRLLSRPWFERVWVLQEVNWAQDAEVFCGSHKVAWTDMKYACQAVNLQRRFGSRNAFEPPAILRFASSISMVHRADAPGNLLQRLHETRNYKATDARDKIFALLATGFTSEHAGRPRSTSSVSTISAGRQLQDKARAQREAIRNVSSVVPNYSKSTEEVYTDIAIDLIARDKNLDVLCGVQSRSRMENLPSWVPDWSIPAQREVIGVAANKARYNASGDQDLYAGISTNKTVAVRFSDDRRTLTVRGFTFSPIVKLTNTYAVGKTPTTLIREWEQCAKDTEPYPTGQSTGTVFLETVIACRPARGATSESFRWLAYAPLWKKHWFEEGEKAWDRVHQPKPGSPLYGAWQLGEKVKDACSGRCLMITANGYMGLAPSNAQVGDVIAIFQDGQVPFILRPRSGETSYTLIGESYLGGLMDGKALVGEAGAKRKMGAIEIK